jgi:hypothetical protein
MRLAAIYNIWDGVELLPGSISCVLPHVQEIIIVYQTESNYGERFDPLPELKESAPWLFTSSKIRFVYFNPVVHHGGAMNEIAKRNMGLDAARKLECTHFLHMDCDEYYKDFPKAIEWYERAGAPGSVCMLFTYFKAPTLRFLEPDGYFVPFIHELRPDSAAGVPDYPYWADPTRRIGNQKIALLPVFMHHFSWVRKDIERKCRNSSARKNIEHGTMLDSYRSGECGAGFYVKDYCQKLTAVDDFFNLNAIFDSH